MTSSIPAIDVQQVNYTLRGHFWQKPQALLKNLSLRVEQGETVGLIGHNGAGKTTLMRILLGLIKPETGMAALYGKPVHNKQARQHVGFLLERPYAPDTLTATEYLLCHAQLVGLGAAAARSLVKDVLEQMALTTAAHKRLGQYSKGMLQRVGLAQALLHNPRLLILDEPMSGLDPAGREDIRNLLLSFRQVGKTVLFSSHSWLDVELVCDRVIEMQTGQMVHEVHTGYFELFVKQLGPQSQAAVAGFIDHAQPCPHGGVKLTVKDLPTANQLLSILRQHDVMIYHMQQVADGLKS